MPSLKISQMTSLTGANVASGDLLPIVDISDTSQAASGTNKKITADELRKAIPVSNNANAVVYVNASNLPTSSSGLTFDGTNLKEATYNVATQIDVGTAPLNQYLGGLAYVNNAMTPVPASATAVGEVGDIAQDGSFLYVCVANNSWKRVAIAAW
jgi:hypothetical protein